MGSCLSVTSDDTQMRQERGRNKVEKVTNKQHMRVGAQDDLPRLDEQLSGKVTPILDEYSGHR